MTTSTRKYEMLDRVQSKATALRLVDEVTREMGYTPEEYILHETELYSSEECDSVSIITSSVIMAARLVPLGSIVCLWDGNVEVGVSEACAFTVGAISEQDKEIRLYGASTKNHGGTVAIHANTPLLVVLGHYVAFAADPILPPFHEN